MNSKDHHLKSADRYFDFLAERFPVMCASDEFHFLPRAESATKHYDKLDDLGASLIEETIGTLKSFQKEFSRIDDRKGDLDGTIDLKLLRANIAGILIELDTKRSWQYNPLLYLKIAFIGLDHALTKPAADTTEIQQRARARLSGIPGLLRQGMDNIQSVPETYYQTSIRMAADCKQYLSEIDSHLSASSLDHQEASFSKSLKNAESSLEEFRRFLKSISPEPEQRFASSTLETSLKEHFLLEQTPEEIFAVAAQEWKEVLRQLNNLQSQIDPQKTWHELYHAYNPSQTGESDTFALYGEEIDRLRTFFYRNGFKEEYLNAPIEIIYTPTYLKSVRSSASFAAAFSQDPREMSYFYISTHFPQYHSQKSDRHLQKRLNREYKMLAAHETIPGHHFLDAFRRGLKNPIRRQIESPLFYEGWASYAESMLIEYGYLDHPLDLLVSAKRNLWRAARCQIDVGLSIGKLSENHAVELLKSCGFTSEEALIQMDRYRLNPGYQLCYSYGSHEFKQLKKNYGNLLAGKDFYNFLLEGGELPFDLIEKRLENLRHKD